MNPKLKKQYQWLQVLVYALQLERWPLEEEISRRDAFAEVVRFASILGIKVEPSDPSFLPIIANKIAELLAQPPEQPTPSIPLHLRELVEIYEKHLKEERKKRAERLPFPTVDEQIKNAQRIIQKQIEDQIRENFEPLNQNPELAQEISFRLANQVITRLPPVAIKAVLKEEDYQTTWQAIEPEVNRELNQAGVAPEPKKISSIGQTLVKTTFAQAKNLAATRRIEVVKEKKPPLVLPKEEKVIQAEKELERKIEAELPRLGISPYSPKEQEELTREAKDIITAHLLELPKKEITQAEYEKLLRKAWLGIEEEFKKRGIPYPKETQVKDFIREFVKKSQREAAILTTTAPRPLPKEAAAKLAAEEEGVAFPAYWYQLPMWAAYLKRAIFGPPKKVLEIAASETTPEWQEMIEKGLFAEDIEASIAALKEAGLPESHPTIKKLEAKKLRFLEQQKIDGKDQLATRILKGYWEFPKRLGRHQILEPETRMYLPRLSPPPVRGRLQQFFNRIGLALGLYQKVKLGPGKTVIRPFLSERLMRFITAHRFSSFSHLFSTVYRKTLGRLFAALKETGVVKKTAAWIAAKAGVKLLVKVGIKAAAKALIGAVSGVLTGGIGTLLTFLPIEKLASPFKRLLRKFFITLGGIGAFFSLGFGVLTAAFVPISTPLLIPVTFAIGTGIGAGIFSFIRRAWGGFAGLGLRIGSGISGFFATLTTAEFGIPVVAIIGGTILFLILGGTAVSIIGSSAFVLPPAKGAYVEEPQSTYIEVVKTATPTTLSNPPADISYEIKITAKLETITNIRINNQTTVTNEDGSFSIEKDKDGKSITTFSCPELAPGETCTLGYIIRAEGTEFENSTIFDQVAVLADVPEENLTDEKSTASTTVIIGTPPTYCFVFQGDWDPNEKALMTQSINRIAQSRVYIETLCEYGEIQLIRTDSDPGYSGRAIPPSKIILYNRTFGSFGGAVYTLSHESGHLYGSKNGDVYLAYLDSGAYESEGPLKTYRFCPDISRSEDFAEMIGVYIIWRLNLWYPGCIHTINYPIDYPLHYNFAKINIFDNVEY